MNMIGHPAIGVNTVIVFFNTFGYERFPEQPVIVRQEDILPVIASQNDVIKTARQVYAGFSGHVYVPR